MISILFKAHRNITRQHELRRYHTHRTGQKHFYDSYHDDMEGHWTLNGKGSSARLALVAQRGWVATVTASEIQGDSGQRATASLIFVFCGIHLILLLKKRDERLRLKEDEDAMPGYRRPGCGYHHHFLVPSNV